jgi:hypothetical protein
MRSPMISRRVSWPNGSRWMRPMSKGTRSRIAEATVASLEIRSDYDPNKVRSFVIDCLRRAPSEDMMHYEPNRVLDEWITATAQVMASSFEALLRKTPLHARIDAAGWSFRPRFASKYCAAQPPADICPAPVTLPGLDALVAFDRDRRPPWRGFRRSQAKIGLRCLVADDR